MGSWVTLQRHYAQLRQSTGRCTSQVMDIMLDRGDFGMVPTPACLHEVIFERQLLLFLRKFLDRRLHFLSYYR